MSDLFRRLIEQAQIAVAEGGEMPPFMQALHNAVRDKEMQAAALFDAPDHVPWSNAETEVCVGCGSLVPSDFWPSHVNFHVVVRNTMLAVVRSKAPAASKCDAHGNRICLACSLNPSTCAQEPREEVDDDEPTSCGMFSTTGWHWRSCPNRVTDIDPDGIWSTFDNRRIDPAAERLNSERAEHVREIEELTEELRMAREAERTLVSRQVRWYDDLDWSIRRVVSHTGTVPFDILVRNVDGITKELKRLRALEQACVEAGASRSTPDTIMWVKGLVAGREQLAVWFRRWRGEISSDGRDWNATAVDAMIYAVFVGWDCEEDHQHDAFCDTLAEEVAPRWEYSEETVAELRSCRSLVRAMQDGPPVEVDRTEITKTLTEGFEPEPVQERHDAPSPCPPGTATISTGDDGGFCAPQQDTPATPAEDQPCPSLYLHNGALLTCDGRKGHVPGHGNYEAHIGWQYGDVGEVPVPWPVDQEPPAGIDILFDLGAGKDGRPYLVRCAGDWQWSKTREADPGLGVSPWEIQGRLAGGELVVVRP